MMVPVIKIDAARFNRALHEYMTYSKRTLAEELNQKAYSIAMSAEYFTKKADKAKMASEIGPTGYTVVGYELKYRVKKRTKKEAMGGA